MFFYMATTTDPKYPDPTTQNMVEYGSNGGKPSEHSDRTKYTLLHLQLSADDLLVRSLN